jgi:hypothetical protein
MHGLYAANKKRVKQTSKMSDLSYHLWLIIIHLKLALILDNRV